MVTRAEFVAEVRSWVGTPYRHQGRLKGVGVDCGGLLTASARNLGISDFDVAGYERQPDGSLEVYCAEHMDPIAPEDVGPADVLLFSWDRYSTHIGIVTATDPVIGLTLCHAYIKSRKVVEHRMDAVWRSAVAGAYRIRELAE